MVFAIILFVLLAFSLLGNFMQLVSRAFGSGISRGSFRTSMAREVGPRLEECVLKDTDARYKIAVVTVDGIITDNTSGPGRQQHGGRDQGAARPREG